MSMGRMSEGGVNLTARCHRLLETLTDQSSVMLTLLQKLAASWDCLEVNAGIYRNLIGSQESESLYFARMEKKQLIDGLQDIRDILLRKPKDESKEKSSLQGQQRAGSSTISTRKSAKRARIGGRSKVRSRLAKKKKIKDRHGIT